MKKIFTLLYTILFALQFTSAQQTLFVLSKSGSLAAYPASKVSFDNDIFTFTYGEVTELTKEMFSASFSIAFKSSEYKSLQSPPDVGICFSDTNETPTITDRQVKIGTSLDKYTFNIYGLDGGTTYYYRAYVKVNDAVYYGAAQSVTTFGKNSEYKIINGHKFVDLGLPSGLLWATCNIGAATTTDYGDRFAWGETQQKKQYNENTYKYMSDGNITKYNETDGKTILDKEDDAADANWGLPCRMPTSSEFKELLNSNNCTWAWSCLTFSSCLSIYGFKITSTKNGNSIFLPAFYYGDGYPIKGSYWSSNLASDVTKASYFWLDKLNYRMSSTDRYTDFVVRPVAEP